MKYLFGSVVAMVAMVFAVGSNTGGEKKDKKVTIKEVMAKVFKGPICGKLAKGEASEEEKKIAAKYVAALPSLTPPKGDAGEWKKVTTALADAAKSGDAAAWKKAFTDAGTCKGCHANFK
jgi:hypothetical protein